MTQYPSNTNHQNPFQRIRHTNTDEKNNENLQINKNYLILHAVANLNLMLMHYGRGGGFALLC